MFYSYVVAIFVCRYNSLMLMPLCLERVASLLLVLRPSQLWSLYSLTRMSCPAWLALSPSLWPRGAPHLSRGVSWYLFCGTNRYNNNS